MLNWVFALVLTSYFYSYNKTSVVSQAGSILILLLLTALSLISTGITESIIPLMLLLNTAIQVTVTGLVALDSSSFIFLFAKLQKGKTSVFQILQLSTGKILPHCRWANTWTNLYLASWLSERIHGYSLQVGNAFNKPPMRNYFFIRGFGDQWIDTITALNIHTFHHSTFSTLSRHNPSVKLLSLIFQRKLFPSHGNSYNAATVNSRPNQR